jgi:hypothetical protein
VLWTISCFVCGLVTSTKNEKRGLSSSWYF